jgi:hypothetical protein
VRDGGAVIPKECRHVLLRQPPTAHLVAVTPRTTRDQGVGQSPHNLEIAGRDFVVTALPMPSARVAERRRRGGACTASDDFRSSDFRCALAWLEVVGLHLST